MAVSITKPTVGGSEDSWGTTINTALDDIVLEINSNADGTNAITPNLTEGSWEISTTPVTASAADLNAIDGFAATGVTVTELGYVSGASSNIQDQIDAIVASGGAGDGTITLSAGNGIGGGGSFTTNQSSGETITFTVGNGNGLTQTADGLAMSGSYTGSFSATGDITAFSDAALKSDIQTISDALQRVTQMRGVFFDKDGRRGTGVVAQEVQSVIPEAVHDSGEYLSVAYGNLVGVLIEAVKELATEVKALKDGVTK
jgi:hypothetical protein